jgi:hypothetical protein
MFGCIFPVIFSCCYYTPPANLQGIWNDAVQPPWGSNYTTNINTQMISRKVKPV